MSGIRYENNIIKMPELNIKIDPRGIGYAYYDAMKNNSNKLAQIYSITGEEENYSSLLNRSIRCAIHMKKIGITSKDIISICSFNNMDSHVPFIAAMFIGAKVASLDPRLSIKFLERLVDQVKPKIIFADDSGLKLLEETNINVQIVTFASSKTCLEFKDFQTATENDAIFKPVEIVDIMETAVIFFTSGSTGFPKGVCLNHLSIQSHAYIFCHQFGDANDRTLISSTLYWISGVLILTGLIIDGNCRVICPNFEPREAWENIDAYKITFMFISSVNATIMYKLGKPKYINALSLKKMSLAGSIIPQDIYFGLKKLLPNTHIAQGYGQTEAGGCLTVFNSRDPYEIELGNKKPLSCGRPLPGIWYKIVEPSTDKILGPNQQGELRVKSKFCLNGYLNATTSDEFDDDGYLKTGDLFYYDKEFCFYFVERLKEVFKYKCWIIAPAVIEIILQSHPAVKDVMVVGIPHECDVTHALGVVVLKDDYSNISEEELVRYVEERVDEKYRLFGGVKFVEDLPKTPTGKLNRDALKKLILTKKL